MPCSMTAFAQAKAAMEWGEIGCELRTVNHRFLEFSPRLPEELRQFEPDIRARITASIKRGRVDCTVRFQPQLDVEYLQFNDEAVAALSSVAANVRKRYGDVAPIRVIDILRWPGVMKPPRLDAKMLQRAVVDVVSAALKDLLASRKKEGEQLAELVLERVASARKVVVGVKEILPSVNETFRQRLLERLAEVQEQLEAGRVEQEMVIFSQKMDVSEELDRLEVHLDEVQSVLAKDVSIGRRLDFLMQELHREANTLGAKSVDTAMTQASLELKVLIEQMREQVQNLE